MLLVLFSIAISFFSLVASECPNACSAHGKCTNYDMCICYRNWMANDCSERICQFGRAHVDTPKGDLDASGGKLTGPNKRVVYNDFIYPKGTTEQYPETSDLDGLILRNTAHEYRECSNKGICDRSSGTCACFEGYEGSACQRASCPSNGDGVCSGHGTCETIQEIANRDTGNIYRLWDAESTLGCVCDGGFTGPDCSEKICKYGTDPLYYDGPQTVRYSNWTFFFYTQAATCLTGNYSLVFTDSFGEDWQTVPIDAHATCDDIQGALESLPNNVVPVDSVRCFKSQATTFTTSGCLQPTNAGQAAQYIEPISDAGMIIHSKYTIAFPSNPGKLPQISVNKYLDGKRPTLYTNEAVSTLGWKVFANGFTGEDVDYVPDLCEDVLVTLSSSGSTISSQTYHYLTGLDSAEEKLLKICLGDSDGNSADNVETYNWDYGNKQNPHLIKLVDATQDTSTAVMNALGDITYDFQKQKYPISRLCAVSQTNKLASAYPGKVDDRGITICEARDPPGFYAVLYFDSIDDGKFKLYNRAGQDFIKSGTTSSTTQFYVFTTKGYLQLVNPYAGVFSTSKQYSSYTNINKYYTNVVHQTNVTDHWGDRFHGNMDCETNPIGLHGALDCINKGDKLMLIDTDPEPSSFLANSVYPNMYTVKKITRERKTFDSEPSRPDDEKVRNSITLDISLNTNFQWAGGTQTRPSYLMDSTASVFKFHPDPTSADGGYLYATECSNRGICNTKTGQCQCFAGFSTDNCGVVNNLVN